MKSVLRLTMIALLLSAAGITQIKSEQPVPNPVPNPFPPSASVF